MKRYKIEEIVPGVSILVTISVTRGGHEDCAGYFINSNGIYKERWEGQPKYKISKKMLDKVNAMLADK